MRGLRRIPGRPPFRVAVGVAVPAIEAWLLCGQSADVSEIAWLNALGSPKLPYTKSELKRRVYATERPSLATLWDAGARQATRLAQHLALLEQRFPIGFGTLAREVRAWIE